MLLQLKRFKQCKNSTLGRLYINGEFECYTLEDVVRPPKIKVPGHTAILDGTYEVVIDMSSRFKRVMPHILNVPYFEGVRIHSGNTDADTEGCVLLGLKIVGDDFIGESRAAFDRFFPKLQDGIAVDGKAYIVISNEFEDS
jgi:hypothetical protein